MLAQYNLGTDYRQSTTANGMAFADIDGWEYSPGPEEIDIHTWTTNPKTYINAYIKYLQTELEDTTISGDLITLTELKGLGCTINDDYSYSDFLNCAYSSYKSWLINSQAWWTRSAHSANGSNVWNVYGQGNLDYGTYHDLNGVRPVITISKDTIKNLS